MKSEIPKLQKYFDEILGIDVVISKVPKHDLSKLPMYLGEMYDHFKFCLYNTEIQLIAYKIDEDFSIHQLEKHIGILNDRLEMKIAFFADNLTAINRKRLIEKGINFIVPGKQLFFPELLLDLRESFQNPKRKQAKENLLPSAQVILLYHMLNRGYKTLEGISFTKIATRIGYTKTAVTKAVDDLLGHDLCIVEGTKEKSIRFIKERPSLWEDALPLLTDPVIKRVYVDEKPGDITLLHSNESALPEYSDMNPSRQQYFAIEKQLYYELKKNGKLLNPNDQEGAYCLELWKYNPIILANDISNNSNVDPLSLNVSLQQLQDERVQDALEGIIKKYIW